MNQKFVSRMSKRVGALCVLSLFAICVSSPSFATDAAEGSSATTEVATVGSTYSPYVGQDAPDQVFWGDTHLHTSNSPDAGLVGNTLGPDAAYRFARGEEVISSSDQRVKLIRPLDFLVVSDHAEYMGLPVMLASGAPQLLADTTGKRLYEMFRAGGSDAYDAFLELVESASERKELFRNPELKRSVWQHFLATADRFNEPGRFTAFIGFEWSSMPQGNNLHRVVVFKDGADRAGQVLPFSLFDSEDPEDLWSYLASYESKTGGEVLAIPHNGNLSNGMMFSDKRQSGRPIGRSYAEARSRWEPLMEVTQIKGDGETHPTLSPDDEFADFGTWDKANIAGRFPKEEWMLRHEYARSALGLGLELGNEVGENPYKFGMIGSTDSHTSLATSREDNYFGKFGQSEPASNRYEGYVIRSMEDERLSSFAKDEVASGLAGVWARENTRAAIFEAMKRKEVFATTGSRIRVRVFGGWDFTAADLERPDFDQRGYRGGVPMGGDLAGAADGRRPTILIRAQRDPEGANLDRVQIIKGWVDEDGRSRERIYDVACSDARAIEQRRCERAVGSTVDVANAEYTNAIGDSALDAYWHDPNFDPKRSAFYYVRVIEIPKPRWTAYDSQRFDVDMPGDVSMTLQDRAYTSPIWYTPPRD